MEYQMFIISKKNKWVVESKDGSELERSEHGFRSKAVLALFGRHPRAYLFYLTIPATDSTPAQVFDFHKPSLIDKWRINTKNSASLPCYREYNSRKEALNTFFRQHPKLPLFYITIPIVDNAK